MKPLFASLALTALLAAPAVAGDADWGFKAGQVYTYECKTEFHYVAVPVMASVDGQMVRRGGGFTPSGPSGGGSSGRRGSSDPQWEVVTLRATVLAVNKDGSAILDFCVEDVSIDTRFDDNGDRATWSSKVSATTDLPGYKKYEAIVGCHFGATIAADGTVLDLDTTRWPAGEAARAPRATTAVQEMQDAPVTAAAARTSARAPSAAATRERARQVNAASASHDPTPAMAWLSLIFSTSPDRVEKWNRTLKMPFTENLDVSYGGKEPVGKIPCVRSKFRTSKGARVQDPADERDIARAQTLESFSMESLRNAEKKGHNWFSRDYNCTIKAEMDSKADVSIGGTIVSAIFGWEVTLKAIGKTGPLNGPELPPDFAPFEPPVETPSGTTEAAGIRSR